MSLLAEIAGSLLLAAGAFFFLVGAIGLNRMPEVFTRLHASSVSDTAGVSLVLVGLMFLSGFNLVTAKLVFLFLLLLYTGPVATHAIARAALKAGMKPIAPTGAATEPVGKGRPGRKPKPGQPAAKPARREGR